MSTPDKTVLENILSVINQKREPTTSPHQIDDLDMDEIKLKLGKAVESQRNGILSVPKQGRPTIIAANLKSEMKAKNFCAKSRPKHSKVLLNTVIPFITCNLCRGYLIDATTIVECLHTFCHSCIMIHLRHKQYCPCCELMINQTRPNIKPDAIRQGIVYKLVPGLYEKEILRRQEFYRAHPAEAKLATPEQRGEDTENLIFSPSEKISLSIEYADLETTTGLDELLQHPKYLLCPASFTVNMLSKFVLMKFGIDSRRFIVDISYKVKTIVLSDNYTLIDIAYIYTWKRDAPMRFYFRVRAKETTNEEVPEVPLRRSPSHSTHQSANSLEIHNNERELCNGSAHDNTHGSLPSVETKLKLIKKVKDSQRISDKKRVVYMVQSSQSDPTPPKSAAAEYVFMDTTRSGNSIEISQSGNSERSREHSASSPKYRSLVERENAKMMKLMQSLSEEKKRLKMQKREAAKIAFPSEKKSDALKLKFTKSGSGVMIVQNSIEKESNDDLIRVIGNVANCDENDSFKKSLFLNAFELTAKKSTAASPPMVTLTKNVEEDKLGKNVCSGSQINPPKLDTDVPPPQKSVKQSNAINIVSAGSTIKRSFLDETLGQNTPRKKFSSYVKIAPKECPTASSPRSVQASRQNNVAAPSETPMSQKCMLAASASSSMAPPLVPLSQTKARSVTSTGPLRKKLYKPEFANSLVNIPGYSHGQFQTMPSPIYITNSNAGSTPIYSPNSPRYSHNFAVPQNQEFKYTKLPTYVTNFTMPSNPLSSAINMGGKLLMTSNKPSVQYLKNLPTPPIFNPSSGMSITTTTATTPSNPQSHVQSGTDLSLGKRKNPSLLTEIDKGNDIGKQIESNPIADNPPEKQRKVQSILNSCNITFPSSLSITIANETDDRVGPGTHNSKIKNPVNNYIEILKIPSGEPTNCSLNPNNKCSHSIRTASNTTTEKQSINTTQSISINRPNTQSTATTSSSIATREPSSIALEKHIHVATGAAIVPQSKVLRKQNDMSVPIQQQSSILHTPVKVKQLHKPVARLMPKLKPIDKLVIQKPNIIPPAPKPQLPLAVSKEAFQVEFLKFASDKKKAGKRSIEDTTKIPLTPIGLPSEKNCQVKNEPKKALNSSATCPQFPPNSHVKHSLAEGDNFAKVQLSKNDKGVSSSTKSNTTLNGNALAPIPQQEHAQKEYAAALMKLAIGMQQQQTLAALQNSKFPTLLPDLITPKSEMVITKYTTNKSIQPPPPQQISSLIQQACLMGHIERMKRAGKEALDRYAQGIQHEQEIFSQNEIIGNTCSKPPKLEDTKRQTSPRKILSEYIQVSPPRTTMDNDLTDNACSSNKDILL